MLVRVLAGAPVVVDGVLFVIVFVRLPRPQGLAGKVPPLHPQPRPRTSQLLEGGKKSPEEDFIFTQVRVVATQQVLEKSE